MTGTQTFRTPATAAPWWHSWMELLTMHWLRGEDGQVSYSKVLSLAVFVWCVCCVKPNTVSWPFVAVLLLLLGFVLGPKTFTAVAQRITFGFTRAETTQTTEATTTTAAVETSAPVVPQQPPPVVQP